jgi:hypothetical protein
VIILLSGFVTATAHARCRTKSSIIYKATGNLRAVQILLGHTKIESTVRYLGVDVADALALVEGNEVQELAERLNRSVEEFCAIDSLSRFAPMMAVEMVVSAAPKQTHNACARAIERKRVIKHIFDDEVRFGRIFETGRYLKLCTVMCVASDAGDRAWARLLNEVSSGSRLYS